MIVGDRVDGVEEGEVVLVGSIVSVPCNDVKGSVVLLGGKERASVLVDNNERLLLLVRKCGDGGLEIAAIGKTVGTDGAKIRQSPGSVEDLANVTTAIKERNKRGEMQSSEQLGRVVCELGLPWAIGEGNREADTALNDTDLVGVDQNLSELGGNIQATLLRNCCWSHTQN